MNRLKKLQEAFRKKIERLEEIRKLEGDALTEEIRVERDTLLSDMEELTADIEAEKRAQKLIDLDNSRGDDGDPDHRTHITVEDQPIYRGKFPLGQQIRDIVMASQPSVSGSVRSAAVSRLEQCAKRSMGMVEDGDLSTKEGDPSYRAAGTGQLEAIGSEGGFLLQSEQSVELMTHGFNNSEILRRCQQRTLSVASKVTIVGIDETSRANGSRGGGIRVYTTAELAQMTSSMTKFSYIDIEPKKLTGLWYASDEILEDAAFLEQEATALFTEEFAFKTQDQVLNGTGAGEPLGIMNADCLVTQAKEAGQAATTIVFENVLNMRSRINPGSRSRYIWLINVDCEPQLCTMSLDVGTGGVPVWIPAGGGPNAGDFDRLFGKPVIPIEQCQTLGTAGDIIAADFSQYITANKGGINSASSIHLKFDYNQTVFRFIYRFDGQPRWVSALTPYKGSNTVSPFVDLATRS